MTSLESIIDKIKLFWTDEQEIAFVSVSQACFEQLEHDFKASQKGSVRDFKTIAGVPFVVNKLQRQAVVFELKDAKHPVILERNSNG